MNNEFKKILIYNNLTRKKEEFTPKDPKNVKFYSCGPTTYDYLHVGNARALVTGDLFYRGLKSLGYNVTFVRNFTDIDDKIIERANKLGRDPIEHAALFVEECKKDMSSLGMETPDYSPKVTETIPEIIKMIETLLEKKVAYNVQGEILYHVPTFKDYGKLSKIDLDGLQHGKRVVVDDHKKHPADFVLWKPSKDGEPGWDSPWGKGRPGWHIECSAMALKFLGEELDLHHGGVDLIFPHHENEIAQSEAANGKCFSSCWCHHEFVNFGDEKMSKSLGNVVTIRNFIESFGGEVLREIFLTSHYRTKLEWTTELIERSISEVERLNEFAIEWNKCKVSKDGKEMAVLLQDKLNQTCLETKEKILTEIGNDFNFPAAMAHFFQFIRFVRRELIAPGFLILKNEQLKIDDVINLANQSMGIFVHKPEQVLEFLKTARANFKEGDKKSPSIDAKNIEDLIQKRIDAKKNKEWSAADQIRQQLKDMNIILADHPDGTTTWKYKD